LGSLGVRIVSVDLNGQLTLSQLRALLAQRRISVTVDRHTVYGAAQGRVYANRLVGLSDTSGCALPRPVRIGLIDGPVDPNSPALRGVPIFSNSVLNRRERVGSADHATGIAALIASPGAAEIPPGLAPGAQLYSVVAFARNGGRDVARLENIAEALDWLVSRKVAIVNMSLAGARNDTLEEIIRIADAKGLVMVAATGNGGRNAVAYPASDPRVIAITAVDAAKRLYRKANKGAEVDFAAPGVDLLVPRRSGSAYRTGTSYAAAVASGLIAQELARAPASRSALVSRLRARALDLGPAGKDSDYGWGLLQSSGC
jgi:subtilisin family serine protease